MAQEFALILLLFVGIMGIAALIFGGYIVTSIFKTVGNMLFGWSPPRPRPPQHLQRPGPARVASIPPPVANYGVPLVRALPAPMMPTANSVPCQGPGCQQMNPNDARFCRRCGHPISQVTAAAQRRVAMG